MIDKNTDLAVGHWLEQLWANTWDRLSQTAARELEELCRQLAVAVSEAGGEMSDSLRNVLEAVSQAASRAGMTPAAIGRLVFSLRPSLPILVPDLTPEQQAVLLDEIGIYIIEVYARTRERVIQQQKEALRELSTPVVCLWAGVLAVPLIGTLDSCRAQDVMERLLTAIVDAKAKVVILDISGVSMVDTFVANHIMKTATAARLLGASLIITGINPAVAHTMIHLGVDLSGMITRAVMADGVTLALAMIGRQGVTAKSAGRGE